MLAYLESAYLPSRVRVSPGYARLLRALAGRLDAFAGRDVPPSEWTESLFAGYLSTRANTLSDTSLNNERRMLLTLADAAYEDELLDRPLRHKRIRRLPEPPPRPTAWTAAELGLLLETARRWPGMVGGIVAAKWWASLVLTQTYTAARISSLILSSPECYEAGRGIFIRESKTGKTKFHRLPPECCEAIDAIYSAERERIWPWPWHNNRLWIIFRRIVHAAGISEPPGGRQLFYRVRRTTLTYCWQRDPALAQQVAGHSDQRVTLRYIDPTIISSPSAMDAMPAII